MIRFKNEVYAVSENYIHKLCSLERRVLRITSHFDGIIGGTISKEG